MPILKKYFYLLLLLFCSLGLVSCSVFGPVKNEQETNTYTLSQLNCDNIHVDRTNLTLLVNTPQTIAAYNTTQMAYSNYPYQLVYFSKSSWADTPPQMLLPLMVQSLQNTHHFHAVVAPPFSDHYDYVLNTQLIQLQQEFDHCHCPSQVRLVMRAQLINNTTGMVVASRQFCITTPAAQASPYGGVVAANCAVAALLEQLVHFTLQVS